MIPLFKPYLGADTTKAAVDALDLGWLGMGSYVKEFEDKFAQALELPPDRHFVAVNTCTSALHLACVLSGVGPGDEVITPSLNNMGDFQAIKMCGGEPVFVDINESDLAINVDLLERLITPKTKAIIALHYMGIGCDMEGVRHVARRHGLRVIEDAAHATVSRNKGKVIGSDGDLACYSFDAIKTLTCIDGGGIVTPSKEEAERLLPMRLLGMTQSIDRLYGNARAYKYDVLDQGYRYHLANLHASIGLSQLKKLPEFIENRRRYAKVYDQLLGDIDGLITPQTNYEGVSLFMYVVRVLGARRKELQAYLEEKGIGTGVHWEAGNRFTFLKNSRGADNLPVTEKIADEILTLPLWSYMDERVIETICAHIRNFYASDSKSFIARDSGKGLLRRVKRQVFELPIAGFEGASLRTVSTAAPTVDDVAKITAWRNLHPRSFQTEFAATDARTRAWLTTSVARDDSRVLFMVQDGGTAIGYVGIAFIDWASGTVEADSVVRGDGGRAGLMSASLRTLLDWARSELELSRVSVRVLDDNKALSFYRKFGFSEVERIPLRRVERADCVSWEPAPGGTGERYLVKMQLG